MQLLVLRYKNRGLQYAGLGSLLGRKTSAAKARAAARTVARVADRVCTHKTHLKYIRDALDDIVLYCGGDREVSLPTVANVAAGDRRSLKGFVSVRIYRR